MINRLQKMKFTLYLDPQGNRADHYASNVLRKWADDLSAISQEEKSEMEMLYAADVHKQIYMGGLFLHLLSPTASKQLSNLVIDGQVNSENLIKSLSIGNVAPEGDLESIRIKPSSQTTELNEIMEGVSSIKSSLRDLDTQSVTGSNIDGGAIEECLNQFYDRIKDTKQEPSLSTSPDIEIQIKEQNALLNEILRTLKAGGSPSQTEAVITPTTSDEDSNLNKDLDSEVQERMNRVKKAKEKALF